MTIDELIAKLEKLKKQKGVGGAAHVCVEDKALSNCSHIAFVRVVKPEGQDKWVRIGTYLGSDDDD